MEVNFNEEVMNIRVCEHEDVFQVPNEVLESDLSSRAITFNLFLNSVEKWNAVHMSVRELAAEAQMVKSTVQEAMKASKEAGLITVGRGNITINKPMELAKGHYFEVHNVVFEYRNQFQYKETVVVYAYLCKMANRRTQQCFPAMRTMGKACSIQWDRLNECLRELEAKGLIHVEWNRKKEVKGNRWDDTHLFTLLEVPAELEGTKPVSVSKMASKVNPDANEFGIEDKKDSEAANNGENEVFNQINTTDIINDNSENGENNLEVDYMSGFLGKFDEVDEFAHTPTIEERGGEDVDAFLKALDPVEEYEEDEEEVMEEVNTIESFLDDISGTKEEEPAHIPSPAVENVAILGKTSDEMVQEANNNVLNYRRNKAPELTKEDKTMSMDEIMSMFG